ncbi:TetR/AcrR family transcriptional regulator [Geobacter sp. FeAm09]|uniref:TetR/AcrR family transcriptional regulator n=1 Tax=Geobacter sp. FeAm09 TaxID=2597769 RepID=UPI0011EE0DC7|nr:TetR/AcrR family transcriptional regulator [Geobacter sp. FeAm09]QEM68289.1 TetR/AcrR family transcriptional regulator [Geobacter sp. FeAm09]
MTQPSENDTRERLVAVASRIFMDRGFARVTMADLARELHMSKKTIYRLFPSKDDLVRAVYYRKTDRIHALFRETVAAGTDFTEKIHWLWINAGKELTEIGARFHEDLRIFNPSLAAELERFRRDEINRNFEMFIENGIRLGALRSDINKELLVQIYISAIMGVINNRVLAASPVTTDQAFRTILDVMFDGILSDGARPHYRRLFGSSV